MKKTAIVAIAAANLTNIFMKNMYHGRGFIIGKSDDGKKLVIVYFMTARSAPSKNRRLTKHADGYIETIVANPNEDAGNIELTLYPAIMYRDNCIVVSNGKQTLDAVTIINSGGSLSTMLSRFEKKWPYEPDSIPTPRITGAVKINEGDFSFETLITLKSLFSDEPIHNMAKRPDVGAGFGYCVTTYTSPEKSNAVPFTGNPYLLPLDGNVQTIAQTYWDLLPEDLRISLAVVTIDLQTQEMDDMVIHNQFELVS
jgi:IMP cyclohydrolase